MALGKEECVGGVMIEFNLIRKSRFPVEECTRDNDCCAIGSTEEITNEKSDEDGSGTNLKKEMKRGILT